MANVLRIKSKSNYRGCILFWSFNFQVINLIRTAVWLKNIKQLQTKAPFEESFYILNMSNVVLTVASLCVVFNRFGLQKYMCTNISIPYHAEYPKKSNIIRTLVVNKIAGHSYVFGASLVGDAPTTSTFSTNTWLQLMGLGQLQDETRNI